MSTKIYDAYKLVNGDNDLSSLMMIANELKQDIEIEARKEITETLARAVWFAKDLYAYYGKSILTKRKLLKEHDIERVVKHAIDDDEMSMFWAAYDRLEAYSQDKHLHLSYLTKTTIVFLPCKNEVFAMLFGNTNVAQKAMKKRFVDYHYQNQTDRPSNITKTEWNKRKADWDIALPDDAIPSHHGLSFDLFRLDDVVFELNLIRDKDTIEKQSKLYKKNTKARIDRILETIKCPLITKGMDYHEIIRLQYTEEYNEWKKAQIPVIAKKLGVKIPKEYQ